tara:strand:+ start:2008 stop:2235 length:228 start_codon:yes stop_codon:yes gene_type:complete
MSKKNPHMIMGQKVQGSPSQGYSVDVKFYKSTSKNAYIPDAQDMLKELEQELARNKRVINARTRKLRSKISASSY